MRDMGNADRIILGDGERCVYSSDSSETGLNNNIFVAGASGSGKTVSIIEPRLLETYQKSLIVTVTKRKIVKKYTDLLRDRGYTVWDLDFVRPMEGNVGFDPLRCIDSFTDIPFLARSIVLANPRKAKSNADPYWDEAAVSLLSAETAYVLMTGGDPGFGDVLDFHHRLTFREGTEGIVTNYDGKFASLKRQNPSCFAVNCWESFRQLPVKTAGCVYSALNTTVDSVFTPEIRKLFDMKQKIHPRELASKKTVLFVTSSPVNPSVNGFISLFYSVVFKELFEFAEEQPHGELPVHVDVLADDFATGCPVNMFEQYISVFREKGLSCTLLVQSEFQLSSIYGSDQAAVILNNCDTSVYMGSPDLETGKKICLKTDKPLQEILYMPVGGEVIFRRGEKPVFTKRYDIFRDETYKNVTAAYEKKLEAEVNAEKQEHFEGTVSKQVS